MNVTRTLRPPAGPDGSAPHTADPSRSDGSSTDRPNLRLVRFPAADDARRHPSSNASSAEPDSTASRAEATHRDSPDVETFGLIQRHLSLARRLGVAPLTVAERAASLLESACSGWLQDGHCASDGETVAAHPHPHCVRAQYHHDLLLLEHGLLDGRTNWNGGSEMSAGTAPSAAP